MSGPADFFAPTACARNRFTPLQRFVILFGTCFPLRYALHFTAIPSYGQALILAGVASGLVWGLWSAGAANRRLMLGITSLLWLTTAVKILRM